MSEIKRLKRDSVPQFNKKNNEEQYKANKAIKDAVEDAQVALQRNDVEKTKQARSTKRFTSLSIRQRSNGTSTSSTAQLSASQLPNLFSRVNPQFSAQRSASGSCFACGKPGHWRACCPNLRFNVPSNTVLNDPLRTSIWKILFTRTAMS